MSIVKTLVATSALALLTACASTNEQSMIQDTDLLHHHWVLEKVNGKTINTEHFKPDMEIGENMRASGVAGCNRFFGNAELKGGMFRIEKMGMTMMACPPPIDDIERTVGQTFAEWSKISLAGEILKLESKDHTLEYRLDDYKQ